MTTMPITDAQARDLTRAVSNPDPVPALPTWSTARPRTPADVRRRQTMERIRTQTAELPLTDAEKARAQVRWMRQRRQDAARNGYRGPLTRAELATQAARRCGG